MSLSNRNIQGQNIIHESPWTRWLSRPWGKDSQPYYCLELFDFVTAIALTPDDQVVLVEQYRPAVLKNTLEFPSGLMDQPHESPEEVAKRELLEETGWKANRAQLVTSCHTDTGRIDNQIHIIFCDQLEAPSQEWKAEKGIHAALKSAHETQKCILNGTISNLMHRGAWLLCREAGHIKL